MHDFPFLKVLSTALSLLRRKKKKVVVVGNLRGAGTGRHRDAESDGRREQKLGYLLTYRKQKGILLLILFKGRAWDPRWNTRH